jgi:hypothetical protein
MEEIQNREKDKKNEKKRRKMRNGCGRIKSKEKKLELKKR